MQIKRFLTLRIWWCAGNLVSGDIIVVPLCEHFLKKGFKASYADCHKTLTILQNKRKRNLEEKSVRFLTQFSYKNKPVTDARAQENSRKTLATEFVGNSQPPWQHWWKLNSIFPSMALYKQHDSLQVLLRGNYAKTPGILGQIGVSREQLEHRP